MQKRPITKENVFFIEPYRSILNLLMEFSDREGLTFEHFRYALVKNHDNAFSKTWQQKARQEFNNQLDYLIKSKRIKSGCVTSKNNLSKFLAVLASKNVGVITKNDYKKPRYIIDGDIFRIGLRLENQQKINEYKTKQIQQAVPSKNRFGTMIFYGLSEDIIKLFSTEEKNKIQDTINRINNELITIWIMKLKKIGDVWTKNSKDGLVKSIQNKTVKDLVIKHFDVFQRACFLKYYTRHWSIETKSVSRLRLTKQDKKDNEDLKNIIEIGADELEKMVNGTLRDDFINQGLAFSFYIAHPENAFILMAAQKKI